MRILCKLLLLLLPLLVAGCVLVGVALAIDREPRVATAPAPPPEAIDRVRRLLKAHDPRLQRDNAIRTLCLNWRDAELLTNQWLGHLGANGATFAAMPGELTVVAAIKLPANPVGDYINLAMIQGFSRSWPTSMRGLPGWRCIRTDRDRRICESTA